MLQTTVAVKVWSATWPASLVEQVTTFCMAVRKATCDLAESRRAEAEARSRREIVQVLLEFRSDLVGLCGEEGLALQVLGRAIGLANGIPWHDSFAVSPRELALVACNVVVIAAELHNGSPPPLLGCGGPAIDLRARIAMRLSPASGDALREFFPRFLTRAFGHSVVP